MEAARLVPMSVAVMIFRRASGWQGDSLTAPDSKAEFRSIQQSMTLAEIYENVF